MFSFPYTISNYERACRQFCIRSVAQFAAQSHLFISKFHRVAVPRDLSSSSKTPGDPLAMPFSPLICRVQSECYQREESLSLGVGVYLFVYSRSIASSWDVLYTRWVALVKDEILLKVYYNILSC